LLQNSEWREMHLPKQGWVLWYGEENNAIRSPFLSIKKVDDENCWNQNELIFVVNNNQ
jgi:hypothetical protein